MNSLNDVERDSIARGFAAVEGRIRRMASIYYRSRVESLSDAIDWLVSETCEYVCRRVADRSIEAEIPARQWLAFARMFRRGYWRSLRIVVDGCEVGGFGDGLGDDVARAVERKIKPLSGLAAEEVFLRYACYGLAVAPGDAPAWLADTIASWVYMPHDSVSAKARTFGLSLDGQKTRERKAKLAFKLGVMSEVFS